MKKTMTMKQLKMLLREGTDPAMDPAAAGAPADPAAAAAPAAPVDPAITELVKQLAAACGLQVTDPMADAAAAGAAPAAPAPVAESRKRLAERRARVLKKHPRK